MQNVTHRDAAGKLPATWATQRRAPLPSPFLDPKKGKLEPHAGDGDGRRTRLFAGRKRGAL